MDMVFNPADEERLHVVVSRDTAQIGPDARFDLGANPRFAVLRAEDDVVMQGGEGVGHEGNMNQPWKIGEANVQASLRDAFLTAPGPWAEAHGYPHVVATRPPMQGADALSPRSPSPTTLCVFRFTF